MLSQVLEISALNVIRISKATLFNKINPTIDSLTNTLIRHK
jgi:hypothetical protein